MKTHWYYLVLIDFQSARTQKDGFIDSENEDFPAVDAYKEIKKYAEKIRRDYGATRYELSYMECFEIQEEVRDFAHLFKHRQSGKACK